MPPFPTSSLYQRGRRAFTLIEVMVAATVLVLLLSMMLGVISRASSVTKWATDKVSAFQGARAAFDLMSRNVGQATLNAYWDYDQLPSPTRYLRKSELHYLIGQAGSAPFPGASGCGQALFFQAPVGHTADLGSYGGLETLLNAMAYYVDYRPRPTLPSPFPASTSVHRFFLMQAVQPTENLSVYQDTTSDDWIDAVSNAAAPIAENVICLIVWPRRSPEDDPAGLDLSSDYSYDSRFDATAKPQPQTAHQLPPTVQLTLVAIDEPSAARLCVSSSPPAAITQALSNLFLSAANYTTDLATLEKNLADKAINFRTFNQTVPIRESKME